MDGLPTLPAVAHATVAAGRTYIDGRTWRFVVEPRDGQCSGRGSGEGEGSSKVLEDNSSLLQQKKSKRFADVMNSVLRAICGDQ